MKQNNIVVVLAAFAAYLILMVVVGAVYMKKTKNSEDYFLGGRGLSGWVAALSAQASDMSGWLLMGLPGTVYALGTGQAWIAVGLFLRDRCGMWDFERYGRCFPSVGGGFRKGKKRRTSPVLTAPCAKYRR